MLKKHLFFIHVPIASALISTIVVDQHPVVTIDDEPNEDVYPIAPDVVMDIPLRRLEMVHRHVISDDYIIYL